MRARFITVAFFLNERIVMNIGFYGIMNTILWLGFVLFIVGLDMNFQIEGENMFIWLAERAIQC